MTNSIYVLGHRGCRHDPYYENSLKAYDYALQECHGLETDIIRSKDGVLFCAHDTAYYDEVVYELARHLDQESVNLLGSRKLEDIDSKEAKAFKLKDGQSLSQLEQLFGQANTHQNKILNLELKGYNIADIFEEIEPSDRFEMIVTSFGHDQLLQMRRLYGDKFKLGALYALAEQSQEPMHPWAGHASQSFYQPFSMEHVQDDERLAMIDPDYFHLEKSLISDEVIAGILKVFPRAKISYWTLGEDSPSEKTEWLEQILSLKLIDYVYAVITDYPKETYAYLDSKGYAAKL